MRKSILTREEQADIAEAVKKAESSTSGEISTALIPESSDYAFFELRASVFFGVLIYLMELLFFRQFSTLASSLVWNSPEWYVPMSMGLLSFFAGSLFYFFSNIPAVDRIIIPKKIMKTRVRARALRHFSESGVYATAEGTGILLFVSFMERRVELIADKGISAKIPAEEWQQIVIDLSASIAEKKLSAGLQKAVTRCGILLSEHFPGTDDDKNELSDRIVILEE